MGEVGSVPFVSIVRDVVNQIVRSALPSRLRGRRRPEPVLVLGQAGASATMQAHDVGRVVTSYNPSTDGDPQAGRCMWRTHV